MLHSRVNQELEKLIPVACVVAAWEVWDYTEAWIFAGLMFFLPFIVFLAVKILRRHLRHKALLESGIDVVDEMSGVAFEEVLLAHFRAMGYRGSLTQRRVTTVQISSLKRLAPGRSSRPNDGNCRWALKQCSKSLAR